MHVNYNCFLLVFSAWFIFPSISANLTCETKPKWTEIHSDRRSIVSWLLKTTNICRDTEVEYSSFDGRYHNLAEPKLGAIEQQIIFSWAGVKVKSSKPNWLEAWNEVMSKVSMCNTTDNALNLFLAKQVVQEVLSTRNPSCPKKYHNMANRKINFATPYIDGGTIYGTNKHWATQQISTNGTINTEHLRFQEDAISAALKLIWTRWHNIIATELHKKCVKWSYDKIYNEARKFTIATQQKIFAYDWLSVWTGKALPPFKRYDSMVDPQIQALFHVAMYLPQSVVELVLKKESSKSDSLDQIIPHLFKVPCTKYEKYELPNPRELSYGFPNINQARSTLGLDSYSNWNEFIKHNKIENLNEVVEDYSEPNLGNLDALLGGTLESKHGPGELFATVILDQFRRIRDGDRFWFENLENTLFSEEDICKIRQISFSDVVLSVTDIKGECLANPKPLNINSGFGLPGAFEFKQGAINDNLESRTIWYILLSVIVCFCLGVAAILISLIIGKIFRQRGIVNQENKLINKSFIDKLEVKSPYFLVEELGGLNGPKRRVILLFQTQKKQVLVHTTCGAVLFVLDLVKIIELILLKNKTLIVIKSSNHYDVILDFNSKSSLKEFIHELDLFTANDAIKPTFATVKSRNVNLLTRAGFQMLIEKFFRVAFAQAFEIEYSQKEMLEVDTSVATEVIHADLTLVEFAECLNMRPECEFVKKVFALLDREERGLISFRAFLDLIILFANGRNEKKAHLLFKMYDIDRTAELPAEEFRAMIESFFKMVAENDSAERLLSRLGPKDKFDFQDFKRVIDPKMKNLSKASLNPKSSHRDRSYLSMANEIFLSLYLIRHPDAPPLSERGSLLRTQAMTLSKAKAGLQKCGDFFCNSFTKLIIWLGLISLGILGFVVVKTFYFYATANLVGAERYVFAISKGACYGILLTYSLLFLTMCRNVLNALNDTIIRRYVPFAHKNFIHSYISYICFIFTVVHVIGEAYIFTQNLDFFPEDLCKVSHTENEIETILLFKRLVAISGLVLVLLVIFIYIFALPYMRRNFYDMFYFSHGLYPLLILLVSIHTFWSQPSLLYVALPWPILIFLLDSLIDINSPKFYGALKIEPLPSGVLCLTLKKRPDLFEYKLGQCVRLAILQINKRQYHRFTLSSTPYDSNLRIYVRPNHECASQLRRFADIPRFKLEVTLDGPYGCGLQQWRLYETSIFIAGGGGVASFASALNDMAFILQYEIKIPCKKAYFIWTSKSQREFQWILDLIKKVDDNDTKSFFSAHLFITQTYKDFDLRTILENICEKHYQRISGRSLISGLKAEIHYERPPINSILLNIKTSLRLEADVGVFSSGPVSLTEDVARSCRQMNFKSEYKFAHYALDEE